MNQNKLSISIEILVSSNYDQNISKIKTYSTQDSFTLGKFHVFIQVFAYRNFNFALKTKQMIFRSVSAKLLMILYLANT